MEILAPDARGAINLVDVAFAAVPEVRNAHKLFLEATAIKPTNADRIYERYHAMIESVARNVDFGTAISGFDLRSGYYPEAMGKIDEAALADAEEKIARAQARTALRDSG